LQGNGAVGLLVAQCAHDFRMRAVARCDGAALRGLSGDPRRGAIFRRLVGTDGRITVTIEAEEKSMRYQGVVPLAGTSLGESLEAYFASSEQLPTRVLLAADQACGAGMLVQKLPDGDAGDPEEIAAVWEGAQRGIERVTPGSIATVLGRTAAGTALYRGTTCGCFAAHRCASSAAAVKARVAGLLRALGAEEVRGVLQEQGAVTVTCEFCHRPYRFDVADVEALFAEGPSSGSEVIH